MPNYRELEEMFTDAEVAKRLKVHGATVRRYLKTGRIKPFYKLGRLVRIPESAVTEYLERQKVEVQT